MPQSSTATTYLQALEGHFWQWEEDFTVVSIPNGSTIAYRQSIAAILKSLSGQGLPRFGSLLLAIVAMNPHGKKSLAEITTILQRVPNLAPTSINSALEFLTLLAEVPDTYKAGKRKILLLRTIFDKCHRILSLENSKDVAQLIKHSRPSPKDPLSTNLEDEVEQDLKTLYLLNSTFKNVDDILQKIAQLPAMQDELLLEKEVDTKPKNLIDEIIADQRTESVGVLITTIWSGLNLPFHSRVPSQQALGGASDITTKGRLDQLLISEHANEDILFLSRLANNEVLYLNREAPPTSNTMKRVLLVDVSLKNWGTPKTIAFSTVLAIALHPKTDIPCEAFAVGNSAQPMNVHSLDGLIDSLQIVEATLDCSAGIQKFFKLNPPSKNREIFVLTERTGAEGTAVQQVLNEFGERIRYSILVDASGTLDVYKHSKKSKRHIQHIELPIEKLWSQPRKRKPKELTQSTTNHPILLKQSRSFLGVRSTQNGEVFLLTKKKSLLRRYHQSSKVAKGWEIFYECIPMFTGDDFEIGLLRNGDYVILTFYRGRKELTLLNMRTKEEKKIDFRQWASKHRQGFIFHDEQFFYMSNDRELSISMDGNIRQHNTSMKAQFDARNREIKHLTETYSQTTGVFKNVKKAGINKSGNLMFNTHELTLDSNAHIRLRSNSNTTIEHSAAPVSENCFEFEDGSRATIDPLGIIVLQSSDETVLPIYIPSVLNSSLGVATMQEFAGNPYYCKEQLFEILLIETGKEPLSVIKAIRTLTEIGLSHAKELTNNTPCNVLYFFTETEADHAKNVLLNAGAEIKIIPKDPAYRTPTTISTTAFYQKYINDYISTVQMNGTTH